MCSYDSSWGLGLHSLTTSTPREVCSSGPATKFRRVVFPAPEGPRTIAVCARASVKVTASRALMMLPFAEYSLETLARSTAFLESALGDLLDSSTWLVPIVKSGHRSKELYELVNNQRTCNAKVLHGPSWTVRLVAGQFRKQRKMGYLPQGLWKVGQFYSWIL